MTISAKKKVTKAIFCFIRLTQLKMSILLAFFVFFKLAWKLEISVTGQKKKFGLISSSGRWISAIAEAADCFLI